jgi:hypothetical protein
LSDLGEPETREDVIVALGMNLRRQPLRSVLLLPMNDGFASLLS